MRRVVQNVIPSPQTAPTCLRDVPRAGKALLRTSEVPGVGDSVTAGSRTGGGKVDWGLKQTISVGFPASLRYEIALSKGIGAPLQGPSCRIDKHRAGRGAD